MSAEVIPLSAVRAARRQTPDQDCDAAFSAARLDAGQVVLTSRTMRLTPAAARILGLNLVALADEAEGDAF